MHAQRHTLSAVIACTCTVYNQAAHGILPEDPLQSLALAQQDRRCQGGSSTAASKRSCSGRYQAGQ